MHVEALGPPLERWSISSTFLRRASRVVMHYCLNCFVFCFKFLTNNLCSYHPLILISRFFFLVRVMAFLCGLPNYGDGKLEESNDLATQTPFYNDIVRIVYHIFLFNPNSSICTVFCTHLPFYFYRPSTLLSLEHASICSL